MASLPWRTKPDMSDALPLLKTDVTAYMRLKTSRTKILKENYAKERRAYSKAYSKSGKGLQLACAKQVVHWMLKGGTLKKEPCSECGNENVEAHHPDYNKPYEVMWLCKRHHTEWHKTNKPIYVRQ